MLETEDELPPLQSPDARRVAARTLVLAAVSCRALIEKDATKLGAEAERTRREGLQWLDAVGAAWELEPDETALLSTSVGQLDKKSEVSASWRSEGMVVLAWALQCTELPSVHSECDPMDVAE
jgi:hypothetical protein